MIEEPLSSGDAGCSAEEYRHGLIRAHAWQQRAHSCEQLTHGPLKKYRPEAEQNKF